MCGDSRTTLLFVGLCCMGCLVALISTMVFDTPENNLKYTLYILVFFTQAYFFWLASRAVNWTSERFRTLGHVACISGLVVAFAAYLQVLGVLDFQSLVQHLPSGKGSGPWGTTGEFGTDFPVGTLNYNRITTAYYLVLMSVLVGSCLQPGAKTTVIYLFIGSAVFLTGSRSGFLALCVSFLALYYYRPSQYLRFSSLAIVILVLITSFTFIGSSELLDTTLFDGKANPISRILWSAGESFEDHVSDREDIHQHVTEQLSLLSDFIGMGFGMASDEADGFLAAHGQVYSTFWQCGILGSLLFWIFYYRISLLAMLAVPNRSLAVPTVVIILSSIPVNDPLLPNPASGLLLPIIMIILGSCSQRRQERPASAVEPGSIFYEDSVCCR
jgi:hypothetical protein